MVRFKNRYISFKINSERKINEPLSFKSQEVYNEIVNKVKYVHGLFGATAIKPGLKVNYYNELTRITILRVRHGPHRIVLSVLPLINKIKSNYCSLKILYVGATLHHCYKALLNFQKAELANQLPELEFNINEESESNLFQLTM